MFSFVPGIEINLIAKRNIRGNFVSFVLPFEIDDGAAGAEGQSAA